MVYASSSNYSLPQEEEEEEDTPLLTNSPLLSSKFKTLANIFIAIVGAGVLGLPYSFKRTGWVMGLFMLFIVAFLTYHCMMLLVHTRRKLESSFMGFSKIKSFGDLGFTISGPIGRFAVDSMIVLSQSAFCVSYLIFISTTLAFLTTDKNETASFFLGLSPKVLFLWGCFPFQLGLNSIPTLTHLAPLSIFADGVDIAAKGAVMVEDVFVFFKNKPDLEAFRGFSVFLYGIGVAVYAFEGIGMVLPLESETKDKEKFGSVLGIGMGIISVLFGAFGALGYFAYGEDTKDIITTNLGPGVVSAFVQLGLCINLFFTFPLMMNPVYEVVERRLCGSRYCLWLRWLLVLLVSLVAILVPNFADFLSLVGSSVCVILGFELGWRCIVPDVAIVVFGIVIAVTGTWSSLVVIISSKA
ncbi:putative amino acid transporter, transmembrane domain-containing protein [Lupinus albus]|uniref:Putative amino acid transporter, transmembrane domain-containing protein n=1 Tax=Lupinus albus TaxID=3870 RepID=A0A6A4P573_LUPAL|nr:putative amino acid transporter, transmembrane domain-containing protein [Lupinus albus]